MLSNKRRVNEGLTGRCIELMCVAWLASMLACSQAREPNDERLSSDAGGDASLAEDDKDSGGAGSVNVDGGWLLRPDANVGSSPTVDSKSQLVITPGDSTVEIDVLEPEPIEFAAALGDGSPSSLGVRWSTSHDNVGKIDPETGVFEPNGAGGVVAVTARTGALSATVTIAVLVSGVLEGDPDAGGLPEGSGGIGGVGGEGGGTKIEDKALREGLDAAAQTDAELVWLYPYDGTVWPRGLPAPLLQWRHGAHVAEAVKLHVEVADAYRVDVYLGRPSALTAADPITHLPIPQVVWRNALLSGTEMSITLTIATRDASGSVSSYVAERNPTWKIAPATLRGTVYYNSYGTQLAKNFDGAMGGDTRFGGATLAIRGGSFDPELIAGSTTADATGCRVCHVVSADGSTLIAQREHNIKSSRYDLSNGMETRYPQADDGKFAWAALSADGKLALGASGPPGTNPENTSTLSYSGLYRVADGAVLTAQGLSEFVTQAATPSFSTDMKQVAFNLFDGPGNGSITADGQSLVVMDVAKVDDSTYRFENPKAAFTSNEPGHRPCWPNFLPDGSGLVFEVELRGGPSGDAFVSRGGARGELWWTDFDGHAHVLERANGAGYLPKGPEGHDDDSTLQYEPTVAPIVAGGYSWVVFTSRRLYGNVATREPFESDPRFADLSAGNPAGPTTKKLWVTALDVPAKSGSDPSHPAFYLPAQELYAGNTRGFWSLAACKPDLAECTGGDECCNGYCRHDVENFTGVCMDTPTDKCAMEYDRCNVTKDCCKATSSPLVCVAGRCSMLINPD